MDIFGATFQQSMGLSGGLATFWNLGSAKCVAFAQSRSWIWNTLVMNQSKDRIHVINVYSPQPLPQKKILWEEIKLILDCSVDEAVCILGDFNSVRSDEERLNCIYGSKEVVDFNEMISDCNLLEVKPQNTRFTWFGPQARKSFLDRIFLNDIWFQKQNWRVRALNKKHSDHKPLVLLPSADNWGPKPLKLFNYYLNKKLIEQIQQLALHFEIWKESNIQQALKTVKLLIKATSKNAHLFLGTEILHLEQKLNFLENQPLKEAEHQSIKEQLQKLYLKKESFLK